MIDVAVIGGGIVGPTGRSSTFSIAANGRVVNVLNPPSPAATAALNIGKLIVERL
jgi:hypothetical protein